MIGLVYARALELCTWFFVLCSLFVLEQVPSTKCQEQNSRTYTNPIIDADYSDPDVIRVGDDFYLTASSFNSVPGLPILRSKDLVNWKIIGHALQAQTPRLHSTRAGSPSDRIVPRSGPMERRN